VEKLMFRRYILILTAVIAVSSTAWVSGQAGQTFQFVVSAIDEKGEPITDLKPEEVLMSETAGKATVTKLEPFSLPVKVTITVDNGDQSADALPHYRAGLKGFVEAFAEGTEFTLITTSPQPRMVVRPSTDRMQVLRGVNGFAPEQEKPRFTDALVEYSQRLQKEVKDPKVKLYVPVLLMVSTASNESSSYQPPEVQKALEFMVGRKVKMFVSVNSTRSGDATATADLNTNRQAIIAIPATKAMDGRYEAIAIFNRLQSLLPEMGKQLADYQKRLASQHLVTVQRAAAGPMENLRIEISRQGVKGAVSLDGYFPR
jgi:hypothetical protein